MSLSLMLSLLNICLAIAQNVEFYGSSKALEKFQTQISYENVNSKIECGLRFLKSPDSHAFQYSNETKICSFGSLGMFPGDLYSTENDTLDNSTFIIKDCLLQSKFHLFSKASNLNKNS